MSLENVTESLHEGLSLARLAEGEFFIFLLEMVTERFLLNSVCFHYNPLRLQ